MADEVKPQYPRGDVRRLLRLALSMDELERPTLNALAAETGHHKQTILDDVTRLREQLGVEVEKVGSEYRLSDWGPVIKKTGIKRLLQGQMS
ncbi:helix-turn-helix domain-containing protein [Pseudomonas cichorii]|uniref:helix-turn-helix domain-containing protein n=1 Tax=Pseudomonas cichorii TaxID=36746 RepID=UPI0018E5E473|nr:helix-turn-helix domain-containing protein [Pseudomonas cichorii]MBI6855943.1 helix-turn-helix domain-containing protein [Pseudomonas cichorii]